MTHKHSTWRLPAALGATLFATPAMALEIDPHVPPQIDFGGQIISTLDLDRTRQDGDRENDETLNFSDSSLLFGFSKYLHDDAYYAWADFGFKVPDDDTDLRDDIFLHQAYVGVGGRSFELRMGRTNLPNSLLRFPTARGEDLLDFTHVRNAFVAEGHADEWELYGAQLAGSLYRGPWRLDAAAIGRAEVEAADASPTYMDFNSGSLQLSWQVPEDHRPTGGLRYAGLGLDSQRVKADDTYIHALLAGISVQLNGNPEGPVNLDTQIIRQFGTDIEGPYDRQDMAMGEHTSLVAALRYRHKPYLQPRWQAALTLAWQDYDDLSDGRAYAIAPSFSRRLGKGVEAIAQYRYVDHQDDLAQALHFEDRHSIHVGLVFSFDYTLNKSVGRRDSILFLEHGMSDYGPVRGGH